MHTEIALKSCFVLACVIASIGCGKTETVSVDRVTAVSSPTEIVNREVELSCGQCQFEMEGTGCDLTVRIDGQVYFVDGSSIDDHGDAHADDGLCNCIRKATVSGKIENGRLTATSIEQLSDSN